MIVSNLVGDSGSAPIPLEVLSQFVDGVGDRAGVFVDGGILSGADVVAAAVADLCRDHVRLRNTWGTFEDGRRGVHARS